MLTDSTSHAFVVPSPLYVNQSAGECSVTEGDCSIDAWSRIPILRDSSRDTRQQGSDMPPVEPWSSVSVADLQDMQNHMRETIDRGLEKLRSKAEMPFTRAAGDGPTRRRSRLRRDSARSSPAIADQLSAQNQEAQRRSRKH